LEDPRHLRGHPADPAADRRPTDSRKDLRRPEVAGGYARPGGQARLPARRHHEEWYDVPPTSALGAPHAAARAWVAAPGHRGTGPLRGRSRRPPGAPPSWQ